MSIINKVSAKSVMPGVSAVPDVVDAPTIGTATDVGTSRAYNNGASTVTFTAAATGGAATSYTAISTPGSFTASGASSPLTVTGLSSATSYTFKVYGTNASGTWSVNQSSASNSITATTVPQAPTIGTPSAGTDPVTQVSVPFTANATGGSAITGYTVTSSPGSLTGTGASSPIVVSGLTGSTSYTFTVTATNANGTSSASSASSSITTATPSSFESIATATGTGSSGVITFSSIPSTYKNLQLRIVSNDSGYSSMILQFNNDTSTNYAYHSLSGNGTTVSASGSSPATYIDKTAISDGTTNIYAASIIDIIDYASTSKIKTVRSFTGRDDNLTVAGYISLASGLWVSTSAITTIKLTSNGGNFTTASKFALYGIKG